MIRVTHLITGLERGGAETMLAKLVSHPSPRLAHRVVAMVGKGPVAAEIEAAGVPVDSLGLARGIVDPRGLLRMTGLLRREPPDILQCWLYHAELLGLLAGRLAGVRNVLWNLRCSDMDMGQYSRLSRLLPRLLARLSGWPRLCVVNSRAGRDFHERLGYRPRRWVLIPNGFDLDRFRPDAAARAALRGEFGVGEGETLIGLPARVDPMKDHATFLAAAARLAPLHPELRFVLVGKGTEAANAGLGAEIAAAGLAGRVIRLGLRHDMARIYPALDIVTLSSAFGEGFPNVLGEAMASAIPCVATDVGDAADILGDTGRIVPARDPARLADAWAALLSLPADARRALGLRARDRVLSSFALDRVAGLYEDLYAELVAAQPGR